MSFNDIVDTLSGQITNPSESPDGLPSYLRSANVHQLASGGFSLFSPDSWETAALNTGKFAVSALARGISSIYNMVPDAVNWFGGEMERADTYEWLQKVDSSFSSYYLENANSINIVGDIGASIVPGMAGIKVLNMGQKALALATQGKQGFGIASALGLLPEAASVNMVTYGKEIAAASQSFKLLDAKILGGIAKGYAQQVLEQGAFLTAAQVAMQKSPLFENEDASDIFWNALGGGLVGGAIMGTISTAQVLGNVRKGVSFTNKILNPASQYTSVEATASSTDKIITYLHSIHNPPEAPALLGEAAETAKKITATFENKLAQRQDDLWLKVRSEFHNITKDTELGNKLTDTLKGLDFDQAVGNLQYLQNVGRLGKENKQTAIELLTSKILRGKSTEELPNLAINYLKIGGEGAGTLYRERPVVVNLADTLKDEAQVIKAVKNYGFKIGQDWSPAAAADHFEAEARQIWASGIKSLDFDTKIAPRDLPLLEKAFTDNLQTVTLTDGRVLNSSQELLEHIQKVKGELAVNMRDLLPNVTTAEIAKRLNVRLSYLEGDLKSFNQASDLFAFQSLPEGHWKTPTFAKLAYDVQPMNDINGHVMDAITHAKANQKELREAANRAFQANDAEINSLLPAKLGDKAVASLTRFDSDQGMFKGQNSNYGTLGSIAQQVGSVMNQWKSKLSKAVDDRFTAPAYKALQNQEAKDDIVKAYNLVLGSPEKYVLDKSTGRIVNKKILEWEMNGAEGEMPVLLDANSPTALKIKSPQALELFEQMIAHNDEYLSSKFSRQALQVGATPANEMKGTLYFPPPDPKNFPHFAFVVDSTVTGTGHVKMIHAASELELEKLVAKVDSSLGLKAVTKSQNKAFFEARQQYEYNLGINENYINSALARQGVSAPFFAVTDAEKVVTEFLDWRKRIDVANAREWIKLKYAPEIEQINQLAKAHDDIALSVKANTGKYAAEGVNNPYSNVIKTMLDVSTKEEYPIWTPLNKLAETAVSSVVNRIRESFIAAPTGEEFNRVSKVLEESGIHANFQDAATLALANHSAPKPILQEFIRKANSVLSFLMLRADPLNAVNNGFGHAVLYGTETRDLVKNILKGNADAAGELAALAHVKIPGQDLGAILSPSKLASGAISAWSKVLGKDPEALKLLEEFKAQGWIKSLPETEQSIVEAATLKGIETPAELKAKENILLKGAKLLATPATALNEGVENFNRFRSAWTAKAISDVGVKAGVITKDQQLAYINTFVNRVEGNYLVNQRPMLFQGPVGQAVGLFQTYQFNLMQQLFRYVSEGGNKSAAMLLGLQGTVYGMNGLPAFNAINQHIIGNWKGNTDHQDVISRTYDTVGKEAGDWLMYGAASNLFLHPDLKVNLYSRGDINPRQITVIPTNVADVPIVGAVTKLFSSIKTAGEKLGAGADPYSTFLQGIEHAGISRPLAGLAQIAEAFGNPEMKSYSTTSKGSIIGSNDLMSIANFGRLAGGRPLDEAIANDAVYRIQAYAGARAKELQILGEAIKSKVQTGTLDAESFDRFTKEYAERGGKQQEFSKYVSRLILGANKSTANNLIDNLKSPGNQYMQSIMGGYRLQDLGT